MCPSTRTATIPTVEPDVLYRPFRPGDAESFRTLNEAWITRLFKLEASDRKALNHPEEHILAAGGHIFMAERDSVSIGCCALIAMEPGTYEVAKMAVADHEQGRGIGGALLSYVVEQARALGARRLYIETNRKLHNAIHLYEAVGFRHLGPGEITPSPYERADVFMECLL